MVKKFQLAPEALINTYALLFFSNNKLLAALLLIVSFFNPIAGATGLCAVIIAVLVALFTGMYEPNVKRGLYSYNALFIGIGIGTFYNPGLAFFVLLFITVLFSVVLSAVLHNRLSKRGLPFLSLPFIFCFWLILLVTKEFSAINLSTRNIYWLNEMYAVGDEHLVRFVLYMENLNLPPLVATFFKALSSVFFQNNILAGMLIAFAILMHSRILFSLLVVGFFTAYGFNHLVRAYDAGINYYLLGVNFMMVSIAVGSFFVIPSIYSYLWAIISVPISFIMVIGLGKIMGIWLLPVYSLPFCITVLLLLYFFMLRTGTRGLVITPLQLYSPEKNLYTYLNNRERLLYRNHIRLQLPFLGEWMVSQGYNGSITHKGDWSKALDFIIVDHELKTYSGAGQFPGDFYCFNKPVLAPADGIVQEVEDFVDDNPIGEVNKEKNWGNSIVIKHAEGLYTKMSHLRKNSFKVKTGDYVKKGDIIAACGNSGRSPEPHLHYQVQATPFIGSKTLEYPYGFYWSKNGSKQIASYSVPRETELVSNVVADEDLKAAFKFPPGYKLAVSADGFEDEEWEVFTDAYNKSYIYCQGRDATAYFEANDAFFYFTAYYGTKNTLLYYFYIAAYKILLSTEYPTAIRDTFPLQLGTASGLQWLQDFVAPFYIFSRLQYESANTAATDIFNPAIEIKSSQALQFMGSNSNKATATIQVTDKRIANFTLHLKKQQVKATCSTKQY